MGASVCVSMRGVRVVYGRGNYHIYSAERLV
jgi:hypothetical protein